MSVLGRSRCRSSRLLRLLIRWRFACEQRAEGRWRGRCCIFSRLTSCELKQGRVRQALLIVRGSRFALPVALMRDIIAKCAFVVGCPLPIAARLALRYLRGGRQVRRTARLPAHGRGVCRARSRAAYCRAHSGRGGRSPAALPLLPPHRKSRARPRFQCRDILRI